MAQFGLKNLVSQHHLHFKSEKVIRAKEERGGDEEEGSRRGEHGKEKGS